MTTPTGYLPTGYLQGLLDRSSPKPWVYQIVSTVIRDGLPLAEKYTHQICNEHGPLMEETGGWETEGRDPDFELAALAPALAEKVIQLRGIIEACEKSIAELEAQLAAVENPAPAHPEYLETLQDYEDAPVGTVVEKSSESPGECFVKINSPIADWYDPSSTSRFGGVRATADSRRVLYWPEQKEHE